MWLIDDPTAVAVPPSPPAAGAEGWFTNGNPALGIPATLVPDWWLNAVQAEICAVISAGGVGRAKGNGTQMIQALINMFPGLSPSYRSLTSPGYIFLPGNLVLQWLFNRPADTDSFGQSSYNWAYPITYSTAVLGVLSSGSNLAVPTNSINVVEGTTLLGSMTLNALGGPHSAVNGVGFSAWILGV